MDVNGFANDGLFLFLDEFPANGDFTGFDSIDNRIGVMDVAFNDEAQIAPTAVVPLSSDKEVGWMVVATSTSSVYDIDFWIDGYFIVE